MVMGLQSISHFQKKCEHLMLPRSGGRFLGVSLGEPSSGGRVLQRGCLGEDACVAEAEITANGGGGWVTVLKDSLSISLGFRA